MNRRASGSGLGLTLGVLLVVYVFNFLDRQIVTILAEPIARELGLSDTQIGVLTGLSFALLYSALGLPIARLADRPKTDRVKLIAAAVAVWSVATALCGGALSFVQLAIARVFVGVGEAGGTPPAHSLISDVAPPEKRARAFAIYQLGPPIGGLIGMVLGGLLAGSVGWRMAFVFVGLPGLVLAVIVALLLRDPRRSRGPAAHAQALPLGEALRQILASKAMRLLLATAGFASFATYGVLIWTTIFFQRSHGLTPAETGLWFGLVNGIGSILGVWLGGQIGDRHRARGNQHLLTIPALAQLLSVPFLLAALAVPDWRMALVLIFPAIVLNWLYVAPYYSAVQGLVPPAARAVASAAILFMQNLIGLGLGPVLLGYCSDLLKPTYGAESVRYVLFIAGLVSLIAGGLLWRARKYLPAELDRYPAT
ncbi:MAG: transporter [Novosphingobium sp.]|nr:transporter [Novosphingobium sp.]